MPTGIYKRSVESNAKRSATMKNKYIAGSIINPMKNKEPWNKNRKLSKEHVIKLSQSHMGLPSNRKGRCLSGDTIDKIRLANIGKKQSEETIQKRRFKLIGKIRTEQAKSNYRAGRLTYIRENCLGISVRTGKNEKEILDKIQSVIGFSIKRNFFIDGYYLDGYCQELNLAIEVDEEKHFCGDSLRDRDVQRQNRIQSLLNCKFLRIREKEYLATKQLCIPQELKN